MTENEAKEYMENEVECIKRASHCDRDCLNCELVKEEEPLIESYGMAIQALEEIQWYRAYREIFESHFSKEALELLSDKEEFGKWLERGKWIAKRCDELNRELEQYSAIGTIEEFKDLKEKNEQIPIIHGKAELELHDKGIRNKVIDEVIMQLEAEVESSAKFIREYDDSIAQKAYYKGLSNALKIAEEMKK